MDGKPDWIKQVDRRAKEITANIEEGEAGESTGITREKFDDSLKDWDALLRERDSLADPDFQRIAISVVEKMTSRMHVPDTQKAQLVDTVLNLIEVENRVEYVDEDELREARDDAWSEIQQILGLEG